MESSETAQSPAPAPGHASGFRSLLQRLRRNNPLILSALAVVIGVASGIAAYKREPDLALGNLIGSNIFNVFLAAGISASIIPLPVDAQALEFDLWWMTGIALLVGLMMMHKGLIHRWKGALLLLIYLAYIGWIGGAVAAVAAI